LRPVADPTKTATATITVTSSGTGTNGATTLTSGTAVGGLSGAVGSQRLYAITVPTGATALTVRTTGGSGDVDLYVRRGSPPTSAAVDCASEGDTTVETCTLTNPAAGEWYILLVGFQAYSGVALTASVTGGGGTGGGGALNLVCPGSLPTGYQCLQPGTQQAPGRFDIDALWGTWVEASAQVCMTLSSNGVSSFKYRSGFPAGSGKWGALVTRTGAFQPTSSLYYVFTGANDPQIVLLTFDASSNPNRFVGWGFAKGSCPW
jgi:hypothetical protein